MSVAFEIRRLQSEADARTCAEIMSTSDPWMKLGRTFEMIYPRVTDPDRETWVACEGHEVVGFIILSMRGPWIGYVQTLATRADRRGCGIGSRLLAWAEDRMFSQTQNVFMCVMTRFGTRSATPWWRNS